jgi:LytS/YehU family sensor histidine kinase
VVAAWFLFLFGANAIAMSQFGNTNHFKSPPFPPPNGPPGLHNDGVSVVLKSGFMVDVLNRTHIIFLLVFMAIMGISIAYFFLKEWAKADLSRNQMQANQLSTELKFLKSQINPHFLFNTLNNLFSMAQDKGNDELADGISKLSGMMRYMIYESNAEKVPLTDEIAYIKNSIALNKLRYADDEAVVTFDFPDKIENVLIAPMLYIPFVENAFKHGVSINQRSKIDIAIAVSGNQVLFTCENKNYSFVKKMDDQTSGVGLENVKRRLELVYPGKYELTIKSDADKYDVLLKIDLAANV